MKTPGPNLVSARHALREKFCPLVSARDRRIRTPRRGRSGLLRTAIRAAKRSVLLSVLAGDAWMGRMREKDTPGLTGDTTEVQTIYARSTNPRRKRLISTEGPQRWRKGLSFYRPCSCWPYRRSISTPALRPASENSPSHWLTSAARVSIDSNPSMSAPVGSVTL